MNKIAMVGSILMCFLLGYNSFGQVDVWWDNNKASAATSGTWDTTTTNWSLSSALSASTVAFTNGNFPEFAAGSTTISSLTITVNSAVTCAGMATGLSGATVSSTTFSGSGSIGIVTNAGALVNGGYLQSFNCGGTSGNFIINVPLTGAGGIIQHGNGYIALEGANTYSGGTELTGGQIIYYYNNKSFGAGPITVNGGTSLNNSLVNNTVPSASLAITNNFFFFAAGEILNLVGGTNNPGTIFAGSFPLPSGTTHIQTGNSATYSAEIAGVVSGSGGALSVEDDGILELGGTNTYTGATTIVSPALLEIVGSGSLGSGSYSANITNNSTFIYASSTAQTLSGTISGTGKLTLTNANGTLTLSGTNTYTGGTTISLGTLKVNTIADSIAGLGISAIGTSGTLTLGSSSTATGETLNYTGTNPATTGRSVVINGSTTTLAKFVLATNLTLTSGISGGGTPEVNSGTLILTGPNTYTGRTQTDAGGTLIIGGSGNLEAGSYVHNIVDNGTLQFSTTANQTLTSGCNISGSGYLIQNGPGTLIISNNNTTQTFSGVTIVSNGILQVAYDRSLGADPGSIQSTNIILAGGTLQGVSAIGNFAFGPTRGITLAANSGLSSLGSLNLPAPLNGELGVQGPIADNGGGYGLTITGNTNLTTGLLSGVYLEGTNTYSGPTVIQSGILSLYYNGSINNSSSINLAACAGLDVSSSYFNPWNLNQPLIASGSGLGLPAFGTIAPNSAAVMIGTNGGTVNFGSQPLFFNVTPTTFTGDAIHPALYLSQGTLALNGNSIAVTNLGSAPLGFGSYTLVQQASGSIKVSAPPTLLNGTVYGNGIVTDGAAAISVNGGTLSLVVYPSDSSTYFANLSPSPSTTYGAGGNITLTGTVVSTNGGVAVYPSMNDTANITISGVNGGNPLAVQTTDAFGDFTYTFALNPTMSPGNYIITYGYPSGQSLNPGSSATDTSTALMIGQAPLVITATSQTINYGMAVPAGTITYSGFVNGETNTALATQPTLASVKSGTNTAAGIYTGNYTVSGAVDPNYAISYVSGTLTINPAPLVITAASQTINYGATVSVGTFSYSGFVLGQTNTALTTQPTITSLQSGVALAGIYTNNYTVSGAVDANYNISYVPGNLTVNINPFSILNEQLDGNGNIVITWQSSPGGAYQLLGTTNLTPPTAWTNVGSSVVATSTNTSTTNPVSSSVNFYKVMGQP